MADNVSVGSNNNSQHFSSGELCNLTQGYSFILQSVLGVLAFSTLILKRFREPAAERRPFWIWVADTTKQALGMLEIHFLNLALSSFFIEKECTSYLVSFLLDSTIGLFLIFLLLKIVSWLVRRYDVTALKSGEYGDPFMCHYWLLQCLVYLLVMFVEKLLIGPLVLIPYLKEVGRILPRNEKLRIAIVIFIVPFIVNVIMFWIVDSILMRKRKIKMDATSSVHYHRGNARYNRLSRQEESCSESEEEGVAIQQRHLSVAIVTQPLANGRELDER